MLKITKKQAGQFILCKQGLLGSYRFIRKDGAYQYIRQAGCIQYDPVDVCRAYPPVPRQGIQEANAVQPPVPGPPSGGLF